MVVFKLCGFVREEHGQPLFGAQFNPYLQDQKIFATVGSNRATIYQCVHSSITPLQAYYDADQDENFYTCVWSYNPQTKETLLIIAGAKGIIRVLGTSKMQCTMSFTGHGSAVNELKIHPSDVNLLLSASKDYALRLWNLQTAVCVALFGGVEGHRDEVLSADFNMEGKYILSAGMDHALKLWDLECDELKTTIAKSYKHTKGSRVSFPVAQVHFPKHATREIHRNYVDCVRWFGQVALSKSCENNIILWKIATDDKKEKSPFEIMHRFEVPDCEIWYIRFGLDHKMQFMALGNQVGKIFIWDLTSEDVFKNRPHTLTHPKCNAPVRQVTFSKDGSTMISICDNGTVWRWDRKI